MFSIYGTITIDYGIRIIYADLLSNKYSENKAKFIVLKENVIKENLTT